MKSHTRKTLALRKESIRNLSLDEATLGRVAGGLRPRTYGCPSQETISCLPPRSDAVSCTCAP